MGDEQAGIAVWLDGGWGVDALLGEQRREHDDVDLIASLADMPRLLGLLERRGYELADGELPSNVVLLDREGRQVDIHPVAFDERGNGVYRMRTGDDWAYPSWGFAGRGHVGDLGVRCLTPEAQVLCHTGYGLDEDDVGDLQALEERFGVGRPDRGRIDAGGEEDVSR